MIVAWFNSFLDKESKKDFYNVCYGWWHNYQQRMPRDLLHRDRMDWSRRWLDWIFLRLYLTDRTWFAMPRPYTVWLYHVSYFDKDRQHKTNLLVSSFPPMTRFLRPFKVCMKWNVCPLFILKYYIEVYDPLIRNFRVWASDKGVRIFSPVSKLANPRKKKWGISKTRGRGQFFLLRRSQLFFLFCYVWFPFFRFF